MQPDLSRKYSLKNSKEFVLKKNTVDVLKYYNKSPNCRNSKEVDSDFVHLLLVSFVEIIDLKKSKIDSAALRLIKGELHKIVTYFHV